MGCSHGCVRGGGTVAERWAPARACPRAQFAGLPLSPLLRAQRSCRVHGPLLCTRELACEQIGMRGTCSAAESRGRVPRGLATVAWRAAAAPRTAVHRAATPRTLRCVHAALSEGRQNSALSIAERNAPHLLQLFGCRQRAHVSIRGPSWDPNGSLPRRLRRPRLTRPHHDCARCLARSLPFTNALCRPSLDLQQSCHLSGVRARLLLCLGPVKRHRPPRTTRRYASLALRASAPAYYDPSTPS